MSTTRVEAFSDGVIAILITIMVLELKAPGDATAAALRAMLPTFCAYVLSFVLLGIYWNNHHHMLHATDRVNGAVLWANLHLLFWLSLIPFTTNWMGDHYTDALPTAVYGAVLILAACAYTILQTTIIGAQGPQSKLRRAVGSDVKAKVSIALYGSAIGLAFVRPWIADALYVAVALIWLVPDRRIEHQLHETAQAR
jgi:TMEM175 potassium channel family protein